MTALVKRGFAPALAMRVRDRPVPAGVPHQGRAGVTRRARRRVLHPGAPGPPGAGDGVNSAFHGE